MEQHSIPGGHYGFSAVGLDDLGATEYTLVTIACDVSQSVTAFKRDMEKALKEIIGACAKSPRADNLLVRLVTFSDDIEEVHGFKMLEQINAGDYDDCLNIKHMTALYDAAENAIASTGAYGAQLVDGDFAANAIVFVITDGDENVSKLQLPAVKKALAKVVKDERLESLVSILIGVNIQDPYIAQRLDEFNKEVGFTQFVKTEDASAKTLAKLAEFVSKSISSQSKALGTGGASQPLQF